VDEHGGGVENEVLRCGGCQRVRVGIRMQLIVRVVAGWVCLACRLRLCAHDSVGQLVDLVLERPLWDGTVDEWPGRPGVGVLVLLLGGVLEEMGGEVEGAGRAQDADEVGVFGELGVERGGDEHARVHRCT